LIVDPRRVERTTFDQSTVEHTTFDHPTVEPIGRTCP